MKTQQQGFTLIELMIVVLTLAILATIAYPSYETYVRQTRMENVRADLLLNAQMLERYYAQNKRFPADAASIASSIKTNDYFKIDYYSASNPASGDNYRLVATAIEEKNPKETRFMQIDSNGIVTLCPKESDGAASDKCYLYK